MKYMYYNFKIIRSSDNDTDYKLSQATSFDTGKVYAINLFKFKD